MNVLARIVATSLLLLAGGCNTQDRRASDSTPTPEPDPTPTAGSVCGPFAGGPYWLKEGEPVSVAVTCASGMPLAEAALSVEPVPDGASWEGSNATLIWTPRLDQAAVYELAITSGRTGETAVLKIGVADAWEDPANVSVVDPLLYPEEYGIPVIFLSPVPETKEYGQATVVHGGRVYEAEAKLRGAASLDYPKNNYTMKFTKEDKFQEPSRGFVNKRKVNLYGSFDDNSHLRTRLAYDLWNRIDPGHIRMQSYHAVLYLDGAYWGLYTVVDHVDGFLMEDHGYDQDGDLFKAVDHRANYSLSYLGSAKPTPHDGYQKKEGFPVEGAPGAWTDLDALVEFVDGADDATFRTQIGNRIDLRDYRDWWITATLLFANDSVDQNSYHYQDAAEFRFIPWDYNASFGQNWRTVRRPSDIEDDFSSQNHLFARLLADPALREPMFARYGDVLEICPAELVAGWIDALATEIEPSARRDQRKWQEAYRSFPRWSARDDFNDWEGEVEYVRKWVEERWAMKNATFGE